jgi:hypothetical protein
LEEIHALSERPEGRPSPIGVGAPPRRKEFTLRLSLALALLRAMVAKGRLSSGPGSR